MLGEKIREKRNEKGMSMKTLSEMTGLTPGFISQIERELAEPSISSLRKIAHALDVAMFQFFIEEEKTSCVVRKTEEHQVIFPESKIMYRLLSPDLNRQMETYMGKLEPGNNSSEKLVSFVGEEVIYVLEGQMYIELGEDIYTLYAGDTIYFYTTLPHRITNTGDEELVYIATVTPPRI